MKPGDDPLAKARAAQAHLIVALRDPARYPPPVREVELMETHISWILLAGEFAYKIKKAVNLGFLDFGTLEARRRYCEEELRLNRRTAPQLYLEVLAFTGSSAAPRVGGPGPAIEYAVKMRRFAQDNVLDTLARRGALEAALIDRLARSIAAFHATTAVAEPSDDFGAPAQIAAQAIANFDQTERLIGAGPEVVRLERLRRWTERELERLAPTLVARKAQGHVRECHGDLHLGNIALIDGAPTPFDCIEFSAELRWNDVLSELAFLVMDLIDHALPGLAFRCLNGYLEQTGDYAGLAILRHYLVYRAMVRTKVACIRAHQEGLSAQALRTSEHAYRHHLALAERLTTLGRPALVLMHGMSGSGKTTVAQKLLEALGAIRVRSDVERKRLFGLAAEARTGSAVGAGLYDAQTTRHTYDRLAELARAIVSAGWCAIVDATFLKRTERDAFRALARKLCVPFAIVSCRMPKEVLRERIAARERAAQDASEARLAVLESQLENERPLGAEELQETILADATGEQAAAELGWRYALPMLEGEARS